MRSIFALLIFFISINFSVAQDTPDFVGIQWGNDEQTSRTESFKDIVGYDETGIYALKSSLSGSLFFKTSQLTLEHYDNNIKKTKTTLIDLNLGNNKTLYKGIYQFGNRLFLFSSQNDHPERKNRLFVQLIDKKTLKPSREKAQLAEIGYKSRNNDGDFYIRLSRDSTHMIISYDLPYKNGEPEQFGVQIYDQKFRQLWKKEMCFPIQISSCYLKTLRLIPGGMHIFLERSSIIG